MQIKIKAKFQKKFERLKEKIQKGTKAGLAGYGSFVRSVAQDSIKKRNDKQKSSKPGKPPFTHTGALKKSIQYAQTATSVFVGPVKSSIGMVAATHEHGGVERKTKKPRKYNWKFKVGGFGPIRKVNNEEVSYKALLAIMERTQKGDSFAKANNPIKVAKLTSDDMVKRASGLYAELREALDARTETTTVKQYPARPFMGPALANSMTYLELLKFADSLQNGG